MIPHLDSMTRGFPFHPHAGLAFRSLILYHKSTRNETVVSNDLWELFRIFDFGFNIKMYLNNDDFMLMVQKSRI